MGIFRKIGRTLGMFVDVRVDRWMGFSYIKDSWRRTGYLATSLVLPQKARYNETFEEARERLGLTEVEIYSRQREFKRLVIIFCTLGLLVLGYGIGMFAQGSIIAGCASVGIFGYCLGQAFRYHFWFFQTKTRQLGCNFRDWLNYILGAKS